MPYEVLPFSSLIVSENTGVAGLTFNLNSFSQNMLYEIKNLPNGQQRLHSRPRPGFVQGVNIAASNNAQGIYYWSQTKRLYATCNKDLYKSSTLTAPESLTFSNLGPATTSATTGVYYDEFYDGSSYLLLGKAEDGGLFTVTTADVIAAVSDADYTGLSAIGPVAVMDGYVFALTEAGVIAHSDLNAPTSWNALSRISAQERPDRGRCILRSGQYIVVLGEYTTEFFVNAGNSTGSVLRRVKELVQSVGCFSHRTVARSGDTFFWLGKTVEGLIGVFQMTGAEIKKVSSVDVERVLNFSIESNCIAGVAPLNGRMQYILTQNNAVNTFSLAYDIESGHWGTLTTMNHGSISPGGTDQVPFFYGTKGSPFAFHMPQDIDSTVIWMQATYPTFGITSTGNTHITFLNSRSPVFQDGGYSVSYAVYTDEWDAGTNQRKQINKISVLGKKLASSYTLQMVLPSSRTIDLGSNRQAILRCGIHRRTRFAATFSTAASDMPELYGIGIDYEVLST